MQVVGTTSTTGAFSPLGASAVAAAALALAAARGRPAMWLPALPPLQLSPVTGVGCSPDASSVLGPAILILTNACCAVVVCLSFGRDCICIMKCSAWTPANAVCLRCGSSLHARVSNTPHRVRQGACKPNARLCPVLTPCTCWCRQGAAAEGAAGKAARHLWM